MRTPGQGVHSPYSSAACTETGRGTGATIGPDAAAAARRAPRISRLCRPFFSMGRRGMQYGTGRTAGDGVGSRGGRGHG